MDVENYYWVSDEHMVVIFSQKVRQGIQGFNQGVFSYKAALLNLKTQKFKELDNDRAVGSGKRFSTRVVDVLPNPMYQSVNWNAVRPSPAYQGRHSQTQCTEG